MKYSFWTDKHGQLHRVSSHGPGVLVEWWAGTVFGWVSLSDDPHYTGPTAEGVAEHNRWERLDLEEPGGIRLTDGVRRVGNPNKAPWPDAVYGRAPEPDPLSAMAMRLTQENMNGT
jgi:hypothetical protein